MWPKKKEKILTNICAQKQVQGWRVFRCKAHPWAPWSKEPQIREGFILHLWLCLTWKWKLSEGGLHICYRPRVYAYFLTLSSQGKRMGNWKAIQSFPILKKTPMQILVIVFESSESSDLTNKNFTQHGKKKGGIRGSETVFHVFVLHLELKDFRQFIYTLWRLIHSFAKWGK